MYSVKLIAVLTGLLLVSVNHANEQTIPPLISGGVSASILGETTFPPFGGMLFAGTAGNSADPNDTFNGINIVNPTTGELVFNVPNVQAWGAAADTGNRRILFSVASNSIGSLGGDELFALSYDGGTAESLGVILDPLGEPLRMDGLAVIAGEVYAALDGAPGGGKPDGLYLINLNEKNSELVTSFTGIGGLDADPVSGRLFGNNDDTEMLMEIDIISGLTTNLAEYPKGISDIDALAAGENTLYLISDEDQPIQVFDLNTNSFADTLPAAFLTADTFAGAALAFDPPITREFIPPSIPALNTWGLILLSLLLAGIGIRTNLRHQAPKRTRA